MLINLSALYGQVSWTRDHLTHSLAWACVLAGALEGVGVYLAAEAHHARIAGDASLSLRLGAYGVAGVVGLGNFLHWSPQGTPAAVTFGLLSASSPWLWSIRSRSMRRDQLRAAGMIDPRAVRFSAVRWTLYPARTFKAFRAAVWAGVNDPAMAIAMAGAPPVSGGLTPASVPSPVRTPVCTCLPVAVPVPPPTAVGVVPSVPVPPSVATPVAGPIPPSPTTPSSPTAATAMTTALPAAVAVPVAESGPGPEAAVAVPGPSALPVSCACHPSAPVQWSWPA
jgi:hypothetical protein